MTMAFQRVSPIDTSQPEDSMSGFPKISPPGFSPSKDDTFFQLGSPNYEDFPSGGHDGHMTMTFPEFRLSPTGVHFPAGSPNSSGLGMGGLTFGLHREDSGGALHLVHNAFSQGPGPSPTTAAMALTLANVDTNQANAPITLTSAQAPPSLGVSSAPQVNKVAAAAAAAAMGLPDLSRGSLNTILSKHTQAPSDEDATAFAERAAAAAIAVSANVRKLPQGLGFGAMSVAASNARFLGSIISGNGSAGGRSRAGSGASNGDGTVPHWSPALGPNTSGSVIKGRKKRGPRSGSGKNSKNSTPEGTPHLSPTLPARANDADARCPGSVDCHDDGSVPPTPPVFALGVAASPATSASKKSKGKGKQGSPSASTFVGETDAEMNPIGLPPPAVAMPSFGSNASALHESASNGGDEDGIAGRDRDPNAPFDISNLMESTLDEMVAAVCALPPGYVGAYSREQRLARIERFRQKRHQRVWVRKVKYRCRKNLADQRPRVKGRFAKNDDPDKVEPEPEKVLMAQQALAADAAAKAEQEERLAKAAAIAVAAAAAAAARNGTGPVAEKRKKRQSQTLKQGQTRSQNYDQSPHLSASVSPGPASLDEPEGDQDVLMLNL